VAALFSKKFVPRLTLKTQQATDPEMLLLLEARQEKPKRATWQWAAARMTVVNVELKHRSETVWTAEWYHRIDDRQPYITFAHKRSELPVTP
jgi:hypothetical protein